MPRDVTQTDVALEPPATTPSVLLLHGDALTRLRELPDASVHCVCTSPSYYGLRDYQTATWEGGDPNCAHKVGEIRTGKGLAALGEKYRGGGKKQGEVPAITAKDVCPHCGAVRRDQQIGLERTPSEYVERLVEVFREVRRVLRDDGTFWLVIGDSYAGFHGNKNSEIPTSSTNGWTNGYNENMRSSPVGTAGYKAGDLMEIPSEVARALRIDGWYLRSRIVWWKNSCMPESTTNRPSSAHETVFMFTKAANGVFWWHRDGFGSRVQPKPDWRWIDALDGSERSVEPEGDWKDERVGDAKRWQRKNLWSGEGNFYDLHAVSEAPADSSIDRISQANFANQTGGEKDYGNGTNSNRSARKTLENFAQNPTRQLRNTWDIGEEIEDDAPEGGKRWRRVNLWHGEGNFYDLHAVSETAEQPDRVRADKFGGVTHKERQQHSEGSTFVGSSTRQLRNTWDIGKEIETQPLSNRWIINPEPLLAAHYAAMPTRLASRCIQASTSEYGSCGACGAPYRRMIAQGAQDAAHAAACGADATGGYTGQSVKDYASAKAQDASATKARILAGMREKMTVAWTPTCACGCDVITPCVVLDPFSGAGTVALSAVRLGRDAIGVELNASYNKTIAIPRLNNPKAKCLNSAGERLAYRACTVEEG